MPSPSLPLGDARFVVSCPPSLGRGHMKVCKQLISKPVTSHFFADPHETSR